MAVARDAVHKRHYHTHVLLYAHLPKGAHGRENRALGCNDQVLVVGLVVGALDLVCVDVALFSGVVFLSNENLRLFERVNIAVDVLVLMRCVHGLGIELVKGAELHVDVLLAHGD